MTLRSPAWTAIAATSIALAGCDPQIETTADDDEVEPIDGAPEGAACGSSFAVDTARFESWSLGDDRVYGFTASTRRIEGMRYDGRGIEEVAALDLGASLVRLSGDHVYFAHGTSLARVPAIGGSIEVIVDDADGTPRAMSTYAGRVFWIVGGDVSTLYGSTADGNAMVLAEGTNLDNLRGADDRIYFTATTLEGSDALDVVASVAVQGGTPAIEVQDAEVLDYVVDDGEIFVVLPGDGGATNLVSVSNGQMGGSIALPSPPALFDEGFVYAWQAGAESLTLVRTPLRDRIELTPVLELESDADPRFVQSTDQRILVLARPGTGPVAEPNADTGSLQPSGPEVHIVCKSAL